MAFTLTQEKQLDHVAADWLVSIRRPSQADISRVYLRAVQLVEEEGFPISKSLVERSYRELLAKGEVVLVTEKLAPPESVKEPVLTKEMYQAMPAAVIARKYMIDRTFKAQVDTLIEAKLI